MKIEAQYARLRGRQQRWSTHDLLILMLCSFLCQFGYTKVRARATIK